MGGSTLAIRVVSILSNIVLARILDPKDFGIISLATIVLSTANLFSGLGMGSAVIQSQDDRRGIAFHAFAITFCSGLLLFGIIEAYAAFFAGMLGDPGVTDVLRWMALLVPLGALTIVPEALLQKDQIFSRVSMTGFTSEMVYILASIVLAVAGFGLWSLVYAAVLRSIVAITLTWSLCPGWDWIRPVPWRWDLFRRLMRFGLLATAGGLTTFIYFIIDNVIVGRRLGATALGLYSKSYDFTIRTVFGFSGTISGVLFTSFAKIQADRARLSQAYLSSLRILAVFTVPLAMGIFVTASEMVTTLLGPKWYPAIPTLEVMAFVGLILPLSSSASALFFATGNPEYNMRAGLVVLCTMVPLIFALIGWGIVGVAWAVMGAHITGFGFNIFQLHRVVPHTASRMPRALFPSFAATAVMMVCVIAVKWFLLWLGNGIYSHFTLVLLVIAAGASYAGALRVIDRTLVAELLQMVRGQLRGGTTPSVPS